MHKQALLKRALNLTQEGKTRVELEFLRLVKDHTLVQITRTNMLTAIVRKDGKNEVAQLAQLWRDAERTHKAEVARLTQLWREEKAAKVAKKEVSYYSFSMRDESTKKWIPILRSGSGGVMPRIDLGRLMIDVTVDESTICKAAGDTVAGTTYTSHLLKGVMRVEKVDENILDSELGWVCSKEDAKVLSERAGLTNEAKKKANAWAKAHHALERRVAATSESRRRLTSLNAMTMAFIQRSNSRRMQSRPAGIYRARGQSSHSIMAQLSSQLSNHVDTQTRAMLGEAGIDNLKM